MDKLPVHKIAGVAEAIEAVGATLLYLPAYRFVAFDLLVADGVDGRPLPLLDRKARRAVIGKGLDCAY